jgi:phage terminase large subunit-like protein
VPRIGIDFDAIAALPPGQRERALAIAQEMIEVQRSNPLEGWNPFLQQAQLHGAAATHSTRAFFGGNRAGKTTSGVVDDLLEVTPRELVPAHLQRWKLREWECPRYLRVASVSEREVNAYVVPKFMEWTPKAMLGKQGWKSAHSRGDQMIRFECGCTVQLMTYKMDREAWGGASLHRVHYDEEPPEELYEEGSARLVDFNGSDLFTMTPLMGLSWMFDGVWGKANRPGEDIFAVVASMLDNPNISKEGIRKLIRKFAGSPELMAARIHGRFVHFGGLVYPQWPEWRTQNYDRDHIRSCETIVGIDPGARFFGLSWNAFDGFENQIQYASHLVTGEHVEGMPGTYRPEGANVEHAVAAIRMINERWNLDPRKISYVIDPAARARSPIASETIETLFANYGIYASHAQNDVEARILRIRQRGACGAFVTLNIEGNEAAQWEAERYRVKDRADGKFDVEKEKDHVMDATGYAAMERAWDPPVQAELSALEQLVEQMRRDGTPQGIAGPPPARAERAMHPLGKFV